MLGKGELRRMEPPVEGRRWIVGARAVVDPREEYAEKGQDREGVAKAASCA